MVSSNDDFQTTNEEFTVETVIVHQPVGNFQPAIVVFLCLHATLLIAIIISGSNPLQDSAFLLLQHFFQKDKVQRSSHFSTHSSCTGIVIIIKSNLLSHPRQALEHGC